MSGMGQGEMRDARQSGASGGNFVREVDGNGAAEIAVERESSGRDGEQCHASAGDGVERGGIDCDVAGGGD